MAGNQESAVSARSSRHGQCPRHLCGHARYSTASRFARRRAVHVPVGAVLSGRRNNPPDRECRVPLVGGLLAAALSRAARIVDGLRLFADRQEPQHDRCRQRRSADERSVQCALANVDLNSIITSMILTELGGFSTPAGHIGPRFEVGHDISLLIPEVWCRMGPEERDPQNDRVGMLEKIEDIETESGTVPASRLGYRITRKFVRTYLGRSSIIRLGSFPMKFSTRNCRTPSRLPTASCTSPKPNSGWPRSTCPTAATKRHAHRCKRF